MLLIYIMAGMIIAARVIRKQTGKDTHVVASAGFFVQKYV
jgi:hypothetical protein